MGVSDYRKGWDGVGIGLRRGVEREEIAARKRSLKSIAAAKRNKPNGGKRK